MMAGLCTAWDELSKIAEEYSEGDDLIVACDPVIEYESSEVAFDWRARSCS